MTDKQHPAQFDWATELSDAQEHITLSAQEANEIGARLRSMGEKLKAYEDLDEAASDVQLLRMGYAAARLEIESLQARIKTMAEEHADELMVAHLDGRSQAAQPAGAQQPDTAYAELPSYEHQRAIMEAERNASLDEYSRIVPLTSTESMIYERAFTNGWNRRASHGQAPAQAAPAMREAVVGPSYDRVRECAARLVEHADFQLGGTLSADSKARDIPSRACSQVKARHLAALRDALAAAPQPDTTPQADSVTAPAGGWHPFPHYLQNPDGRLLRTSADLLERHGYTGCSTPLRRMADALLNEPAAATPPAQAADSVLEDAASAGFFLQLPQRPKPEAPAGTAGLDWDAYSGAQMLAYGRDCSNAAIVAAQKPGGL